MRDTNPSLWVIQKCLHQRKFNLQNLQCTITLADKMPKFNSVPFFDFSLWYRTRRGVCFYMASVKTRENKSLNASQPADSQTYIFHCSKDYHRLLKRGTLIPPAKTTVLLKKNIRIHWMKQIKRVRVCCIKSHSKMHKQSLQKLSESFPDECPYHRPSELCSFFQPFLKWVWNSNTGYCYYLSSYTSAAEYSSLQKTFIRKRL